MANQRARSGNEQGDKPRLALASLRRCEPDQVIRGLSQPALTGTPSRTLPNAIESDSGFQAAKPYEHWCIPHPTALG